ncbi:MAG: hypothetical protein ACE5IJ_02195 [Thermoplasmata archaeon]
MILDGGFEIEETRPPVASFMDAVLKYSIIHICHMTFMYTLEPPKPAKGPSPRLKTLHEVELILRKSASKDEGPLSLAEIRRRMKAKSVRHSTVRTCVNELKRLHLVTEDPGKGVMWTLYEDPEFWSQSGLVEL